jgi:hypothetical protein
MVGKEEWEFGQYLTEEETQEEWHKLLQIMLVGLCVMVEVIFVL